MKATEKVQKAPTGFGLTAMPFEQATASRWSAAHSPFAHPEGRKAGGASLPGNETSER